MWYGEEIISLCQFWLVNWGNGELEVALERERKVHRDPAACTVNPPQARNPIHWGSPFKTWQCIQQRERERQLESAEASSMAVICRLASTPLPWVLWLSDKSVRLVIGRSWVQFSTRSLWYFSLSKPYIKLFLPTQKFHNGELLLQAGRALTILPHALWTSQDFLLISDVPCLSYGMNLPISPKHFWVWPHGGVLSVGRVWHLSKLEAK